MRNGQLVKRENQTLQSSLHGVQPTLGPVLLQIKSKFSSAPTMTHIQHYLSLNYSLIVCLYRRISLEESNKPGGLLGCWIIIAEAPSSDKGREN